MKLLFRLLLCLYSDAASFWLRDLLQISLWDCFSIFWPRTQWLLVSGHMSNTGLKYMLKTGLKYVLTPGLCPVPPHTFYADSCRTASKKRQLLCELPDCTPLSLPGFSVWSCLCPTFLSQMRYSNLLNLNVSHFECSFENLTFSLKGWFKWVVWRSRIESMVWSNSAPI